MNIRPRYKKISAVCLALLLFSQQTITAVLPQDRVDRMFHSYDGGGITISGPSILLRKSIGSSVSVSGNYYVDTISSASIDVQTYASQASRYDEEREEFSLGVDYLYEKTILSLGYTKSDENDYEADTTYFSISQDFFGDLTTVTMSFAYGENIIGKTDDPSFGSRESDRKNYALSVSQILTPSLIMSLNYEAITDEGFLNNPYRKYRYVDPFSGRGFSYEDEKYPFTRTSDAAALAFKYYLPYRAAIGLNYREFTDDWDIDGTTITLDYTHPLGEHWIFDLTYRQYEQSDAFFYSDLHEFRRIATDEKDFRGRDKELSDFTSVTYGLGVTYEYKFNAGLWADKLAFSVNYSLIQFDYNNFRDLTEEGYRAGEEPLYKFDADVYRIFFSVWF